MGVGRPNVVLNDQARSGADRHRVEPSVIEFQSARALQSVHEGADDRSIVCGNPVSVRAGNHLFRTLRSDG